MDLITDFNIGSEADEIYDELVSAHRELDAAGSGAFDARLILILMNHVGDAGVIREAIALARGQR
jgi:3-(3-hydroxy-phenyl)propionate hydroxylase